MGQKKLNTLAMQSIQHDLCLVQNNWKLGTGKSQTSMSSEKTITLKKICFDWENLL